MENDKKEKLVNDMKTAAKFIRIGRTMLNNIKDDIVKDNVESEIIGRIDRYLVPLNNISETIDNTVIEKFKAEQLMPGCQLAIDFGS